MRLVGYVREMPTPSEMDSAYAQADRIRRTAQDGGHSLVAVCQDVPRPGVEQSRDGYLALLGVVDAGQVDAVIVSSLDAFSPDMISQEIALWDLKRRGVVCLSASSDDVERLSDPPQDRSRIVVREVLRKVDTYRDALGHMAPPVAVDVPSPEVTVELVPADRRRSSSS